MQFNTLKERQLTSGAGLSVSMARAFRCMESRLLSPSRSVCGSAGALANTHRKTTRSRQRRLLEALADARQAMSEALRIDFGERFELLLNVSDREGWPILELHLIDNSIEFFPGVRGAVTDSMSAGAFEKPSAAIVFVTLNHGEAIAHLSVEEDHDLNGLPELLIENVALFLGRIGEGMAPTIRAEQRDTDPLPALFTATALTRVSDVISRPETESLDNELLELDFLTSC